MTLTKPTLDLRLAAYAAAGAAVAVSATAPSAQAAIVDSGAVNINITNSIDGVYFNLVTGTVGSSSAAVPGYDINPYNNGAGLTFYGAASPSGVLATGTAGTTAVAQRFTGGELVGPTPATGFYNQFQTLGTLFQGGGVAYIGIRFQNEATGAQNYGYVQITSSATAAGFPASITRYGYENTGLAINIPTAVPEPGTTAAMALGALSLGAMGVRRWKQGKLAA